MRAVEVGAGGGVVLRLDEHCPGGRQAASYFICETLGLQRRVVAACLLFVHWGSLFHSCAHISLIPLLVVLLLA